MKPSIFAACCRWIEGEDTEGDAGLVKFVGYEALPEGVVDHPRGWAWFSDRRYGAAKALRELPLHTALERMEERFR